MKSLWADSQVEAKHIQYKIKNMIEISIDYICRRKKIKVFHTNDVDISHDNLILLCVL